MSSKPLKFSSNVTGPPDGNAKGNTNKVENASSSLIVTSTTSTAVVKQSPTNPEDISSPHELTAYVETLLSQLETRFDDMSSQILDRMGQMSSRIDALENAIHDLINGDIARPPTPSTPGLVLGSGGQRQGNLSDNGL